MCRKPSGLPASKKRSKSQVWLNPQSDKIQHLVGPAMQIQCTESLYQVVQSPDILARSDLGTCKDGGEKFVPILGDSKEI